MVFYLGTHVCHWITSPALAGVRLFVSARTMRSVPTRRAVCPYAVDSGGFQELSLFGRWTLSPRWYVAWLVRMWERLGAMEWAAPQDWMCEPAVLAKTGRTIRDHQKLTTENYLELRRFEPALPVIPVLQGWAADDYLRHAEDYRSAGVELTREPLVGVGSVCRRQGVADGQAVVNAVAGLGIRVHAFGFKKTGLDACGGVLASADSLAWSYAARRSKPLPGCFHGKWGAGNCANCRVYALAWRRRILQRLSLRGWLSHDDPADAVRPGRFCPRVGKTPRSLPAAVIF